MLFNVKNNEKKNIKTFMFFFMLNIISILVIDRTVILDTLNSVTILKISILTQ